MATIGDSNRLALDTYPTAAAGTKTANITTETKPAPDGTIALDFVNPVLAHWRLIDRGSELGTDKTENAGHAII